MKIKVSAMFLVVAQAMWGNRQTYNAAKPTKRAAGSACV